jgi:hypothetical protein
MERRTKLGRNLRLSLPWAWLAWCCVADGRAAREREAAAALEQALRCGLGANTASDAPLAAALHDAYALEALARAFAELGRNALAAATLDKLLASSVASAPGITLDRARAVRRTIES